MSAPNKMSFDSFACFIVLIALMIYGFVQATRGVEALTSRVAALEAKP